MKIGNLDIEVITTQGNGLRLRIQGRPYGLETDASPDEVRSLAAYLERTVNTLQDEARVRARLLNTSP